MLLSAEEIKHAYGEKILFDDLSFYLEKGDKVGLIGINGTGKSTLLDIFAQSFTPESGKVWKQSGIRLEYLRQNPELDASLSVLEQVFTGASEQIQSLKEFEAKSILTRLGLANFNQKVGNLSGGERKRVSIASVLIRESDILILDEPTNHLDHGMLEWLEQYLIKYNGSLVMVTHDRFFLERVVNQIAELEYGKLYIYPANYSKYLEIKSEREEMQQATERKKKSLYRKELAWMQQGAKARGTKSRERMQRFENLEDSLETQKMNDLELSSVSSRLGKKILELKNISKSYGETTLFHDFSYMFHRDSRLGILGKNGCGKSTLLDIINEKIKPDAGFIDKGSTIQIGYFSQTNAELNPEIRVIDYIRNIGEYIETPDGQKSAAVMLEAFLFPADLQWNSIGRLSGGEKRRLYLLSVLMSAPNFLILDEPTNDLDIQTLTILEEYLDSFQGPVITVSHDRYFLDRVTDTLILFQEDATIKTFTGNYSEYLSNEHKINENTVSPKTEKTERRRERKLKFTFKEQREFETIDEEISTLEQQIQNLDAQIQENSSNFVRLGELMKEKEQAEHSLDEKTERWMYLQELAEKIEKEN